MVPVRPSPNPFNTEAPEVMEIIAGTTQVRLGGAPEWTEYAAGTAFSVPGNSAFDIKVEQGIAEYVCSFG